MNMQFRSDSQRKAAFSRMNGVKPDYTQDTWQKKIAGVPKYEIDRYYRGIWSDLKPQLEGRNVLIRYLHGGQQVVRRHPPGRSGYTTIEDVDDLSEIVREHGVEIWEETAKKGDLTRGDMAVLDIDNLGDASERDMKNVTKEVYKRMGSSFGDKPYIINTQGGYHVGVKLGNPMPYKTMRKKTDKEVIEPLEDEFPELASRHHGETPVFLDRSPMKLHGSTKTVGSLNLPDLVITERIGVNELGGFRRSKL